MRIRKVIPTDRIEWGRMRHALYKGSKNELLAQIDQFFVGQSHNIVDVFILERDNGYPGGFIELNIRNYAEGSTSAQVPYLEGWFIDEDLRGKGLGKQLMQTAEKWALDKGFNELASDAEIDNTISIKVHKALGFDVVDRIICFHKKL